MHLTYLVLKNFRNYSKREFQFSPGMNVIYGNNGQGKTSLLEAISLLSLGRSFRANRLCELIRKGSEAAYIEARYIDRGVEQRVSLSFTPSKKKVIHNSTTYPSLSSLIGLIPTSIMTPDDDLIKGPPQSRRKFLDIHICQTDPLYLYHLIRYYRAMKQRNHLLRKKKFEGIEPWEEEMAKSATYIIQKRGEFIQELEPLSNHYCRELYQEEAELRLVYDRYAQIDHLYNYIRNQYQLDRPKECRFGTTLCGPHRDEMGILLSQKEARTYCSEGQKRTCATSIRTSVWEILQSKADKDPLMLIDDFGISLDAHRRQNLVHHIPRFGQSFITSVDELPIEGEGKQIYIQN